MIWHLQTTFPVCDFLSPQSLSSASTNYPDLDDVFSPIDLEAVNDQVQQELRQAQDASVHPRALELVPLSTDLPQPLLLADVMRLEAQMQERDSASMAPDHVYSLAIDMDRYVEFGIDGRESQRMYTALSYSVLRERNARMMGNNIALVIERERAARDATEELNRAYVDGSLRKRAQIDEVAVERLRKQAQFQPVAGYLEQRWQAGLHNLVDLGISTLDALAE